MGKDSGGGASQMGGSSTRRRNHSGSNRHSNESRGIKRTNNNNNNHSENESVRSNDSLGHALPVNNLHDTTRPVIDGSGTPESHLPGNRHPDNQLPRDRGSVNQPTDGDGLENVTPAASPGCFSRLKRWLTPRGGWHRQRQWHRRPWGHQDDDEDVPDSEPSTWRTIKAGGGWINESGVQLSAAHLENTPPTTFQSNRITTNKYSILTFLPKNLWEQFHRYANLYFIFVVCLNFVPVIQVFGKEIALIPVVGVLAVTAIKDAIEDYRRFRSDRKINAAQCTVYDLKKGEYDKERVWEKMEVGDIIKLSCNSVIPADLLLLASSDRDSRCHVETANLDGESNLKQREVPSALKTSSFDPSRFRDIIRCEGPSQRLNVFKGFIERSSSNPVPISMTNLLLRGCVVRDTDWIEGLVIYTGNETKSMLNTSTPRYKRSKLENFMNRDVLWCLIILGALCGFSALGSALWLGGYAHSAISADAPFIHKDAGQTDLNPVYQGFLVFWTFIIIYQVMVPLSLYATLELVKSAQIYFIHLDLGMWHKDEGPTCRALNITEDLGQIEHIFSDKTGTLTENQMTFRCCTIGGVVYAIDSDTLGGAGAEGGAGSSVGGSDGGGDSPEAGGTSAALPKVGQEDESSPAASPGSPRRERAASPVNAYPDALPGSELEAAILESDSTPGSHPTKVKEFLTLMAVCNTVCVSSHSHVQNGSMLWSGDQDRNGSGSSTPQLVGNGHLSHAVDSADVTLHDERRPSPPLPFYSSTPSMTRSTSIVVTPATPSLINPSPLSPLTPNAIINAISTPNALTSNTNISALPNGSPGSTGTNTPTTAPSGGGGSLQWLDKSPMKNPFRKFKFPRLLSSMSVGSGLSDSRGAGGGNAEVLSKSRLQRLYEAESPDELALATASCHFGCRLTARSSESVTVYVPTIGLRSFRLLKLLPFDNVRKRMGVILQEPETGEIIMYCKGADSAIMDRVLSDDESDRQLRELVQQQVDGFATKDGLRTLCMAKKVISPDVLDDWLTRFNAATDDADSAKLLDEIERDMVLLGATGIEDRLQENVPETVDALREAGMVVWVLTGDKAETARNIGYSSHLISEGDQVLVLSSIDQLDQTGETNHAFEDLLASVGADEPMSAAVQISAGSHSGGGTLDKKRTCLIVGGEVLARLDTQRRRNAFINLTDRCSTVLCCRTTPQQKAEIVSMVKRQKKRMTLAIGDGANDIAMIRAAHVGVGVSGPEGRQASMAADFAIIRFHHLRRLLFVHGHWCYDRLANMTLYNFYKNSNLIFVLFWFQIYCGFSGQIQIDQVYLIIFHLLFTSLSPLVVGVFDQDLPAETLLAEPHLYKQGPSCRLYKRFSYWITIVDSLYQSVIMFFFPYMLVSPEEIGLWSFGTLIGAVIVMTQLLIISIETKLWTIVHWGALILNISAFWASVYILSAVCVTCDPPSNPIGVTAHVFVQPSSWLILVVSSVMAVIPRVCVKTIYQSWIPSPVVTALRERKERKGRNALSAAFRRSSGSVTLNTGSAAEDPAYRNEIAF